MAYLATCSGDSRGLVLGARAELVHVFDDGRATVHAYCACPRCTSADENPAERA